MTNNTTAYSRPRAIERDARAWSKFSGMKHTEALRLMEHPLAQGILGERISARDVIRVLSEHPVLSEPVWDTDSEGEEFETEERATHLGDHGLWTADERTLPKATADDYLAIVLTAEVIRMFARTPQPHGDVSSYNLKHTAEEFLGEHLGDFSYIANGQAIWAAAALGIPIRDSSPGEYTPNADFGLVPDQVEYARRMRRNTRGSSPTIRAHHNRPPGYLFLEQALQEYRRTGEAPKRWDDIDERAEPLTSPFHEWLITQADPSGERGEPGSRERLAGDYRAGVRDGEHGIAREPETLLAIVHSAGASDDFLQSARSAVVEWAKASPLSTGIRTEPVSNSRSDHGGRGAGSGNVERREYRCPCGKGTILEEHDNIPGFREHNATFVCATCNDEWQFVPGLSVREWRIEPVREASGA